MNLPSTKRPNSFGSLSPVFTVLTVVLLNVVVSGLAPESYCIRSNKALPMPCATPPCTTWR